MVVKYHYTKVMFGYVDRRRMETTLLLQFYIFGKK